MRVASVGEGARQRRRVVSGGEYDGGPEVLFGGGVSRTGGALALWQAFAKQHGSYEGIGGGGVIATAMRSLTGGSAGTVGARSLAWVDLKRSVDDPAVFVGAGSTRRLSDDELNGVVGGHAYSVFRVVEAGGVAAAAAREALLAYDGDTQIQPASQTAATPNKFLPRARTRGVAHTRGLAFGLRCLLLALRISRWATCAERHFEGVPDACGDTTSDCVYNCTSGAACSDPTVCCTYYPSAQLTDMDEMLQLIDLRIDCGHENWVYPHTLNWCSGPWVEEVAWHGSLTSLCTDDWLVTDPCTGGIVVAPPGKTAASYYFPAMYYAWSGVTCVEDEDSGSWEVDILSLVDHNMTCAINATSLDRLDKLEELSLNGNQLYGPLPHWVGKLRTLTKIYLHENALTGALPEGWQHARNLQKISLHTRNTRTSGGRDATELWRPCQMHHRTNLRR